MAEPEPYPCDVVRVVSLDHLDQWVCVLDEDHDGQHIYERIGDEP